MAIRKSVRDPVPGKSRGTAVPVRPEDEKLPPPVATVDAAQERGERLDTGIAIARGGKSTGHVPGAMPAKGR
jgi:hypothetical protein